jgi:hypothetical protein
MMGIISNPKLCKDKTINKITFHGVSVFFMFTDNTFLALESDTGHEGENTFKILTGIDMNNKNELYSMRDVGIFTQKEIDVMELKWKTELEKSIREYELRRLAELQAKYKTY